MSKSSKYTLVHGDSYTSKKWLKKKYPEENWKYWHDYVGEYFDVTIKEIAHGGIANSKMIDDSIMYIQKDHENIERVIIAATQMERHLLLSTNYHPNFWGDRVPDNYLQEVIRETNRPYIIDMLTTEYFLKLITLKEMCDKYNIQLIIIQMLDFISEGSRLRYADLANGAEDQWSHGNVGDSVLYSRHFDAIDEYDYYGWPLSYAINGTCMDCLLSRETRISERDNHPNEKGQMLIGHEAIKFMGPIWER